MSPVTRRRRRLRRLDAAMGVLTVMAVVVLVGGPRNGRAQAADTGEPLVLESTWTDSLSVPFTAISDAFTTSPKPVDIDNKLVTGDPFAKTDLIEGKRDFIVSGTRLTAAEQARAAEVKRGIVSVPVSVTGLVFGMRSPVPDGWQTLSFDAQSNPVVAPYSGRIPLRASLLYKIFVPSTNVLTSTEFKTDMKPTVIKSDVGNTGSVVRSDPGALNVHLQTYLRTTNKTSWDAALKRLGLDPDKPDESYPILSQTSRSGFNALGALVTDTATPGGSRASAGNIGIFTLDQFAETSRRYPDPKVDLRAGEVKNAAGTWVAPSTTSILAGVNAGITTVPSFAFKENAALTDPAVTTAYPITWANWLMAPTSGLGGAKANAVATVIRYLVSDGQKAITDAGDPALPTAMVDAAFAGADDVVRGNCTDTGARLTTTILPGQYAPAGSLVGMRTVSYCELPAPVVPTTTTTTTTTRPATTTRPVVATLPPTPTLIPSGPVVTRPVTTAPTTTAPAPVSVLGATTSAVPTTTQAASTEPTPTDLPYGAPTGSQDPLDHAATMVLGAAMAYVPVRRMFGA